MKNHAMLARRAGLLCAGILAAMSSQIAGLDVVTSPTPAGAPQRGYMEGIVTDSLGRRVFGARVESSECNEWELLFTSPHTRTQRDGYFLLSMRPGCYEVTIRLADGSRKDIEEIIIAAGQIATVNVSVTKAYEQKRWDGRSRPAPSSFRTIDEYPIAMETAGLMEGRVVDSRGRPLEGVVLSFCEGGGACFFAPTRKTVADGTFKFGPVMWNDYAIEIKHLGFQEYRLIDVEVQPGKASIIDIALTPGEGGPWPPRFPQWSPKTRPLKEGELVRR